LLFSKAEESIILLKNNGQSHVLLRWAALEMLDVVDNKIFAVSQGQQTLNAYNFNIYPLGHLFDQAKTELSFVRNSDDLRKYLNNKIEYRKLKAAIGEAKDNKTISNLIVNYVTKQNEISDEEFMFMYNQMPKHSTTDGDRLFKLMSRMDILDWRGIKISESPRLRFIWMGLSKVKYTGTAITSAHLELFKIDAEAELRPNGSDVNFKLKDSLRRFLFVLLQKALKNGSASESSSQ
jgi:hypothetical protein